MNIKKSFLLAMVCMILIGDLTNNSTLGNIHFSTTENTSLKLASSTTNSTTPLWRFSGIGVFTEVDISSDGVYIAAIQKVDNKVFLFNKSSPIPLWNYSLGDRGSSLAISSDGVYIAVGDMEGNLFLFHRASGIPLWNYTASEGIRSVAISSNGSYIAAGTNSKRVYLFNYNSSTPIWSYYTMRMMIEVEISSSGNTIVALDSQDKLYVFGKNSSDPIWIYRNDYTYYYGLADLFISLSSYGNYIALGIRADGGRLCLFDKSSNIPIWIAKSTNRPNSVKISSDGNYIAVGNTNGNISIFKKESNITEWSYNANTFIESVAISSNGDIIATLGVTYDNNNVFCFNRSLVTPVWGYRLDHGFSEGNVGMSADGKIIAVTFDTKVFLFSRDISFDGSVDKLNLNLILISFGFLTFFSLVAVILVIYFKKKKIK